MLPFEIWSANIQYDDKTNKKERPITILGLQGDRVICLKCTTNIVTNIPHQTMNWKKYHLLKPTVIEFKRKYFIKKSNLKYKLSSLDDQDTLNIISGLRLNNLKDFYLENLNESFSDKYDFATHYQRHVQQNNLNKDNVKNQFSFMPPERYEKIAVELMNSPAGPSKSQEHDIVGFKVDQGRYLKFDKRYNTLIIYNPEEKEILTCYKINYNKYLSRLDRDFKGELPENEDKENTINMIEIVEAKKSKKKRKNQTQNTPIFKDANDIMKWVRKRQKGLSPFSYLNPNAGNVEYNTDMFNHMTGADGGDFGSLSGSGNQLGAPAIGSDMGSFGGDAGGGISSGGGMGESFDTSKNKLEVSPKVQKFISKYKELINDEDWDTLFLKYAEKELNIDEQSNLVEILQSIGCDFEVIE